MERFEAAYPLGDEWPPEHWLVPLALPDSQPDGVESFRKLPPADATRLRYTFVLRVRAEKDPNRSCFASSSAH